MYNHTTTIKCTSKMIFSAIKVRVVHPVGPLTALQKYDVKAGDSFRNIEWLPCVAFPLIQTVVNLHRCSLYMHHRKRIGCFNH